MRQMDEGKGHLVQKRVQQSFGRGREGYDTNGSACRFGFEQTVNLKSSVLEGRGKGMGIIEDEGMTGEKSWGWKGNLTGGA